MININDFYLTTNEIMLGETLATQYIWTDENENKVAEFKIWEWWDGINVSDLEVYGEYRRKGLSYQLLDYAVVKCGAKNLAVRKTNSIAKHIYEKYGFEIVEQDDYMNYMTFRRYNMRDPNRIDEFCNELARLWHIVPDWRFGQLMSNVLGSYQAKTNKDIFFPEDDEMLDYFKEYFGK